MSLRPWSAVTLAACICLLVPLTHASASAWQQYGDNDDVTAYYDANSLRRENNLLFVDVRYVLKTPTTANGKLVTEELVRRAVDCSKDTSGIISYQRVARHGNDVTTIQQGSEPADKWKLVRPNAGSIGATLLARVCGDPRMQAEEPPANTLMQWKSTGILVDEGFHYWSPKASQKTGVAGENDVILHELIKFLHPMGAGGMPIYGLQYVRAYNCITGEFRTAKAFAFVTPQVFGPDARSRVVTFDDTDSHGKGVVEPGTAHRAFLNKYCDLPGD